MIIKTVYISEDHKEIWEKIEKQAQKIKKGAGFYICEKLKKNPEINK